MCRPSIGFSLCMRPGRRKEATGSGACSTSNSGTARSSTATAFSRSPFRPPKSGRDHRKQRPMRILWLKSDLLVPPDKGGRLRTWNLLRHIGARHEISYLAFAESDTPASSLQAMNEVADLVETVTCDDPPKGSWKFAAGAAMHLVDPLPYAVGRYRSREYARRVRRLLAEGEFDVLVCAFLCPV